MSRNHSPQSLLPFISPILASTLLAGCGNVQVLNSHESELLTQVRTGQYELVLSSELAALRREAELGRSTGRYQLRSVGFRTWRLDTATGSICLLLTSAADWKTAESRDASCGTF